MNDDLIRRSDALDAVSIILNDFCGKYTRKHIEPAAKGMILRIARADNWRPCKAENQYYISELCDCADKPYLVTYETLKGRRYVAKVNIKNGRLQGKINGTVIAWMPMPIPYGGHKDDEE